MKINYAFVSSFERTKDSKPRRFTTRTFVILLMAVFFIVLMIGLAGGAVMYQKISGAQIANNNVHLQSGLIANTVHVNDAYHSVEEAEGPEGRALVLVESLEIGDFETRLYLSQGRLMQEYAVAGNPFNPITATPLFDTDSFDFSFDGKLLTITTDKGTCNVALRCKQGGAL